jgi:hypothetical protein
MTFGENIFDIDLEEATTNKSTGANKRYRRPGAAESASPSARAKTGGEWRGFGR